MEFDTVKANKLLDRLFKIDMIFEKGGKLYLTGLGRVSSMLYYPPEDIYDWYSNFMQVFRANLESNDMVLSWAVTDIPSNCLDYIPGGNTVNHECGDLSMGLLKYGIRTSNAIHFALALKLSFEGVELQGVLKADLRAIRVDIDRICTALSLIDAFHAHWRKGIFWKNLALRVKYGIDEDLLELVSIPGIGGVIAKKLWDQGIKTVEGIIDNRTNWKVKSMVRGWDKIIDAAVKIKRRGKNKLTF